ncbi:MAG TPA: hypothetical protein V6C57_06670 [Coleofasciculaceae cyanobacterium]
MPRPRKNSEPVSTRIDQDKRDRLAKMVIDLGYGYSRTDPVTGLEAVQPMWGAWLEAIADEELIMFKKVAPPT